MAADGTWQLTMNTPMGERRSTLTLSTSGNTLTGKQEAEGNTTDIAAGTANGNEVSWQVSITNPMPLTLTFSGTVNGTATLELLKVLLRMTAERNGVAAKVIATVDDLEQIAASDDADVPALKGWRREMFGEKALALKHGRLALAVERHRVVAVER